MGRPFNISHEGNSGENYAIIKMNGELDSYSLKDNRAMIMDLVEKNDKDFLLLDMTNLDFINSEAISFLLKMDSELDKKAQKLVIINAKKNVEDVLKVIGIFEAIQNYSDINEFKKNN